MKKLLLKVLSVLLCIAYLYGLVPAVCDGRLHKGFLLDGTGAACRFVRSTCCVRICCQ